MLDARIRIRHIRCFLDIARLGSLSAAADNLRISQPAVSKTIKELEQILDCQLFDRSSKRLTVTPAGRVFQEHVGAGMIAFERAQSLVQNSPKDVQRLTIGVLPTAATRLLPRAALKFQKQNQKVMMRVSTGPNWLLMSQLREGTLDLVVGRMASAKVMEGLSFTPLFAEAIVAITRRNHPILKSDDPQTQIGQFPLIVPPPGAVIGPSVRSFLSHQGIAPQQHAFETVSLAFGRQMVLDSDCIWLISRGVVENELQSGSLKQIPLTPELLGSPVGYSMREDGRNAPMVADFVAELEMAAQSLGKAA